MGCDNRYDRDYGDDSYLNWFSKQSIKQNAKKDKVNTMAESIPFNEEQLKQAIASPMPELPPANKRIIESIPFKLEELVVKKVEKPMASNEREIEITIGQNADGTEIKKKVRRIIRGGRKPVAKAGTLSAYKIRLGIRINTPVFYRYIRIPFEKRIDPKWKGIKRDACIFIYATDKTQLVFTFAIWNGEEPKNFSKDEARFRCQQRMTNNITTTIGNVDVEASCLENIKRAIDNWMYNLNRRPEEPSIVNTRVTNTHSLALIANLIRQKFKMENIGI